MTDANRRLLSLLILFLLGPVLTVLVAGKIVSRRLPAEVRKHEQAVILETGQGLSIGSVEYLRPGTIRYRDVRLIDPITGKSLADAPEITIYTVAPNDIQHAFPGIFDDEEISGTQIPNGQSGRFHWLVIPHLSVESDQIDGKRLREKLLELLKKQWPGQVLGICFEIEKLTFGPLVLHEIYGTFTATGDLVRFETRFQCPGSSSMDDKVSFSIECEPENNARMRLELFVADNLDLPMNLLAWACPVFAKFGDKCTYCGSIRGEQAVENAPWSLMLENVCFSNASLGELAKDAIEYRLEGEIKGLVLEHAEIRSGRLSRAKGYIGIENGLIEGRLLSRLIERFGLRTGTNPNWDSSALRSQYRGQSPSPSVYDFENCLIHFELDPQGLYLHTNEQMRNRIGRLFNYDNNRRFLDLVPENRRIYQYPIVFSALQGDETRTGPIDPQSLWFFQHLPYERYAD